MKKNIIIFACLLLLLTACGKKETPTTLDDKGKPEDTVSTTYDAETIKAQASIEWGIFLDCVAIMETDEKYAAILETYETTADVLSKYYEIVTGRDAQEYLDFSSYEKFLWYTTFINPANIANTTDYETYFSSLAKWNSNVVGSTYKLLQNQGAHEQAEAYLALMEWQYEYFIEYGMMYNFITQQSSEELNPDYVLPPRK